MNAELRSPDFEMPHAKRPGKMNRFYRRQRVDEVERSLRVAGEIQRYRALRARKALDKPELVEAPATIDVQVKLMPLALLQVGAIELFYERNAALRRRAPVIFDAGLLRRVSIEYALRLLVEWELIFAGFEGRATWDEAYFLGGDRVMDQIRAAYPTLAPRDGE